MGFCFLKSRAVKIIEGSDHQKSDISALDRCWGSISLLGIVDSTCKISVLEHPPFQPLYSHYEGLPLFLLDCFTSNILEKVAVEAGICKGGQKYPTKDLFSHFRSFSFYSFFLSVIFFCYAF